MQVFAGLLKSQAELRAYILDYFHGISQNLSSRKWLILQYSIWSTTIPLVIIKTLCSYLESDAPEMAIEIQGTSIH